MGAKADREECKQQEEQRRYESTLKPSSEPLKSPKYILASLSTQASLDSRGASSVKECSLKGSLRDIATSNEVSGSERWPLVPLKPSQASSSAVVDFQSTKLGRQIDRLTTSEQLSVSASSGSSNNISGDFKSEGADDTSSSYFDNLQTHSASVAPSVVDGTGNPICYVDHLAALATEGGDIVQDLDMPLTMMVPVQQEPLFPSDYSDFAAVDPCSSKCTGPLIEVLSDMKVCEFQMQEFGSGAPEERQSMGGTDR